MRFLLDENVPVRLRNTLKAKGFQVVLAVDNMGIGAANHEIAEQAMEAGDIVLTFDEDFLRLRPEVKELTKILYIKIHPRDPREAQQLLEKWVDKCILMFDKGNVVKLTMTGPVLEDRKENGS